jgi:hypothetical protein
MRIRRGRFKAKHPYEVAHIAMGTSSYHGDRGVASAVNGGELPKGRGVSHSFKGKSPSSRMTQVELGSRSSFRVSRIWYCSSLTSRGLPIKRFTMISVESTPPLFI